MSRRKNKDKNVRNIKKQGGSYSVTLPIEIVEDLGWKENQRIVFKKMGEGIYVADWKE